MQDPNINKPQISVVISVKNRSNYLKEALTSLQTQTLTNWECIIVDDYSDEDIKAVVDSMQDERFVYVKNTNKPGISGARNLGNYLAKADWIAVADSDDINLPRRLEITIKTIENNPDADVIHGSMYFLKDQTYELRPITTLQPCDRKLLYERNHIAHAASAYRKSMFLEFGYDENFTSAVDYDLWLSFADRHANFFYLEEPVALYRRHAEQISTDPERKAMQAMNAKKVQEKHPYNP